MRYVILLGLVWALGAGAATAQERESLSGCGAAASGSERSLLGLEVVGLTSADGEQRLVCFSERLPALGRTIGVVTGLADDARLVGIDYRPANGVLYGLGDAGGVYTLDTATAEATLRSRLNVALDGKHFGVDFNPAVDRLRIVSDAGQNLRADVTTGATTRDADLNTPPAAGPTEGVTAAAYTNNDLSAVTATTLFDINIATDQVVIQAPPNNGSLNPAGSLRVDAGSDAGFDIYSRLQGGVTADVTAFAALTVDGRQRFYRVNLLTGEATLRGTFRVSQPVVDIAIPTQQ
jgi:hypothetical protein